MPSDNIDNGLLHIDKLLLGKIITLSLDTIMSYIVTSLSDISFI